MNKSRSALSLTELLAALVIMAILAAYIIPRVATHAADAKRNACHANQGEIELQAQLWRRIHGSFPAADLSDLGANATYLPDGVPKCPVDGTAYTIDTTTGTVAGHSH